MVCHWHVLSIISKALKINIVDLHPLALEDVLHKRGHARSKADYYSKHLFIHVLSHTLASSSQSEETFISEDENLLPPRSSSPGSMTPGDYRKRDSLKEKDLHAGHDDHTMYRGSRPAPWRLGSSIRSRRSTKPDMEMAEEESIIPMTPTRKESAVGFVFVFLNVFFILVHYISTFD